MLKAILITLMLVLGSSAALARDDAPKRKKPTPCQRDCRNWYDRCKMRCRSSMTCQTQCTYGYVRCRRRCSEDRK